MSWEHTGLFREITGMEQDKGLDGLLVDLPAGHVQVIVRWSDASAEINLSTEDFTRVEWGAFGERYLEPVRDLMREKGDIVGRPEPSETPQAPETPSVDPVAALLRESMDAHREAKVLRTQGDKVRARSLLFHAAWKRLEALKLDPERQSPAWAAEQDKTPSAENTHESMMAFYRKQGVL